VINPLAAIGVVDLPMKHDCQNLNKQNYSGNGILEPLIDVGGASIRRFGKGVT
jgi:hypothetical protein